MRFTVRELTAARVAAALERRTSDLPHAIAWWHGARARRNRGLLARYRDLHRGQRCFVLGNGPSLARMDLSPLRDEITFGMNRLYLLFEQMGFVTSYYTCINELVLAQFGDDLSRLPMPRFVSWNGRDVLPEADGLMFLRARLSLADRFEGDVRRSICSGGTVTFATLQLAYHMGFSEVVLIGVDHRFSGAGTPNVPCVQEQPRDDNHCHPDYFPQGSRWQPPDLRRSEQAYRLARDAFERDGRRVLDATVGGALRVFEKADYETLVR